MPFSKMDPSCTIGFYSRSAQDYERISQELSKVEKTQDWKYPPKISGIVFVLIFAGLSHIDKKKMFVSAW